MSLKNKRVLVCDCEGTMKFDAKILSNALDANNPIKVNTQLCRSQIATFEKEAKKPGDLFIACTQEAPMFLETSDSLGDERANLYFTNIREHAGWSKSSNKNVTAKMAALITEAALDIPSTPSVTIRSDGELLVIGDGDEALEAAHKIKDRLNVTLIFSGKEEVMPPSVMEFPIFCGHIETATGHLGAFELKISNYAPAIPASRKFLQFEKLGQSGSVTCDLILDLRTDNPLFTAHESRDGYLKPDKKNPASVNQALLDVTNLVGEFEKPRYIDYDPGLCAHSRSEIIGCTRCIDNCSVGAISPDGDKVNFNPFICAGCGTCSGICPTGAAKYALPAGDALVTRIKTLISTFLQAGGKNPIILFHDTKWGEEMISSLARHFDGLPGNVLPLTVNSSSQLGLESILSAGSFGAEYIVYLFPPSKADEMIIMEQQGEIANLVFEGLGYGGNRVLFIDDSNPENVSRNLWEIAARPGMPSGDFIPMGRKRSIMSLALNHLHAHAPNPVDMIALPDRAPFGNVIVDVDGCTLCLSCVGSCPTGALKANNDKPQLSFSETACVQCGLCKNTCPESVITLQPRLSFLNEAHSSRVIKEEAPFECVKCGKPFGTTSAIDKMLDKLKDHPMFSDEKALNRLKMCDDCRIISMTEEANNPLAIGTLPKTRTTDDYLREREELRRNAAKDMMSKGLLPPKGKA